MFGGRFSGIEEKNGFKIKSLLSVRLFIFEFLLHLILFDQFHASENYTSTLAHKLNHSFIANCEWSNAEHPCYGLVPSVTTCLDVTEGQELTINYGLDMEVWSTFFLHLSSKLPLQRAPEWYMDCWDLHSRIVN